LPREQKPDDQLEDDHARVSPSLRQPVSQPEQVTLALFERQQLELTSGRLSVAGVEESRRSDSAIGDGRDEYTHLVHQPCAQEGAVDPAAAFEEQLLDPELVADASASNVAAVRSYSS
jgi:hypothetical protein